MMADDRVTLSIKQISQNEKTYTTNLMYVNPEATDSQLRALADQTIALTDNHTLVSASRIETRLIPYVGTTPRNLQAKALSSPNATISGNEGTVTMNTLWDSSNEYWLSLAIGFNYDGVGKMYVKSYPDNFPYVFNMLHDIKFITGGTYAGTYQSVFAVAGLDPLSAGGKYINDSNVNWNGDVVLALEGDDTYTGAEFILHFTDMHDPND